MSDKIIPQPAPKVTGPADDEPLSPEQAKFITEVSATANETIESAAKESAERIGKQLESSTITLGGDRPWRDLRPDAQAFDEVRIFTVPRFKQSELSGSEWRISANVQFLRKGIVIFEKNYSNVQTACGFAYSDYVTAVDDGMANFGGIADKCDQEGCAETATVTYRKKKNYCRDGHPTEPHRETLRKFCDKHKTRGDSDLDDNDDNYEEVK